MNHLPDKITYGDKYHPAMEIHDQDEADEYFEALVEHNMRVTKRSREDAEEIERGNLGYWAGYFGPDTRARVERLFHCAHPIFGAIAEVGQLPLEEIYDMGLRRGRELKEVKEAAERKGE